MPLMAVKKWIQVDNTLVYNEDIYNEQTATWVREVKFPKTPQPSAWEAFEAFKEIMVVNQDKETGMVTISIEHYSPNIAKLG